MSILTFATYAAEENYSLYSALDYYDFKQESQKRALEDLMHLANIMPSTQSFKDYYPGSNSNSELLKNLLNFIQQTCNSFTLRTGHQERWEVKAPSWMQQNKGEIRNALQELRFVDEIMPSMANADAICILGSHLVNMKIRLNYAAHLINNNILKAKYIILLAGERKAVLNIDGDEKSLKKIAKKYKVSNLNDLTESHLIQNAYEESDLYNKMPVFFINTPAGNLPRPTTETTVVELTKWFKKYPKINTILFISNQPYVNYQKAIITEVLSVLSSKIKFEVAGPPINKDIENYKLLEALGSYIWAKTPNVISHLNKNNVSKDITDSFKKLYLKNPLIYSDIDRLFKEQQATDL